MSSATPESVLPRPSTGLPSRKLHAPLPSPHLLARAHVTRDLRAVQRAKLVVIRAPAGFGKTATMLQMREAIVRNGTRTGWLTLDDLDNNVPRFLHFIAAAFEPLLSADGATPSGQPDATLGLLERIAGNGEPFSLFLDDFETIHDPAVIAIMREIIDSLPPAGQLVVGSRVIPDLGLARLRALGQLVEMEPQQLRFSHEEMREYLIEKRGLELGRADLARLYNATEGWAAALALVCVALARRDDPSAFIADFSGSNAALADYLTQDVLRGLAEPLRLFLLETSVLTELSAELCDFVRERDDSAALIDELERAQLFLIPLDDQRQLYRYHSLFADFLRAQLRRAHPERIPQLHRNASRWYLLQQRPIAATEHALAGGDTDAALAILARYARTILHNGRARLLTRWLGGVDPDKLANHPDLRAIHLWALFFSQEPEQALLRLDAIESEFDHAVRDDDIAADLLALRPLLLLRMDRFDEAFDIGVRNAAALADRKAFSFGILASSIATMRIVEGHDQAARRMLEEAGQTDQANGSPVGTIYAACSEGMVDLMQGRLRQALSRFHFAERRLAQPSSVEDVSGNAVAGVFHAVCAYEMNDWDTAERRLKVHLPVIKDQGFPDQIIIGTLALVRIVFYRGDIDGAWKLLTDLEYLARRSHWPRAIATARIERSRLILMRGDVAAARRELDQADIPSLWERLERFSMIANDLNTLQIAHLRLMIHAGDARAAVPRLREALADAGRAHRYRRALQLRVLLALALNGAGDRDAAFDAMHAALRDAGSEGFVRLFVDEGDLAAALIQQLALAGPQWNLARSTRDHVDKLLAAFGQSREESGQGLALSGAGMAEALTRKEFQVLKLLAEGLSNDAMATKLFVSETTVRTHLRNINSKLNAGNRTQAVSIARRLGLIA